MIDENQILAIMVTLILIAVAIFVAGFLSTQPALDDSFSKTFGVNNPRIDNQFGTGNTGLTGINVEKWNGVNWEPVTATYVSYSGSTVTVTSGGLD